MPSGDAAVPPRQLSAPHHSDTAIDLAVDASRRACQGESQGRNIISLWEGPSLPPMWAELPNDDKKRDQSAEKPYFIRILMVP